MIADGRMRAFVEAIIASAIVTGIVTLASTFLPDRYVATAVGAAPRNVTFTSGGTEANALALVPGVRRAGGQPVQRLLVSAIEHASVLTGGRFPRDLVSRIGVTPDGLIDLDQLRGALENGPLALVSIMASIRRR